jgi:integrase
MRVEKLTKRDVDAIKAPASGKRWVFFREFPGLGMVVERGKGGIVRKTFLLKWGPPSARRRMVLGRYGVDMEIADAEAEARALLAKIRKGLDPLAERKEKRKEPTLREWVPTYLEKKALRKKRLADDRSYLEWTVEKVGSKKVGMIGSEEVERLFQLKLEEGQAAAKLRLEAKRKRVEELREASAGLGRKTVDDWTLSRAEEESAKAETGLPRAGRTAANRWHASFSACMSAAWRAGMIPENPVLKVKPLEENPPRSRVLDDVELRRLGEAIEDLDDPFARVALVLLVETGMRRGEVLSLGWENVDLEAGIVRLPSPKSGRPETVPLSESAVEALASLARGRKARLGAGTRAEEERWCFPGRDPKKHRVEFKRTLDLVRRAAGLRDFRLHDLRRSLGLEIARRAGLTLAGKVLRHSNPRVTAAVYSPFSAADLRPAVEEVSDRRGKILPWKKEAAK